jgi:hypothetical protein
MFFKIIGFFEHHNHLHGYECKKLPALIGDKEKAQLIMQGGNGRTVLIHHGPTLLSTIKNLLGKKSEKTKS